ncbi:BA71V-C475L [African swine fever virus]|nr:BA71V-C475L [African swine fever virus]
MSSLPKTDFNVPKYRLIAQKREANAAEIEAALEVVREFIIKKKLILYGGIAIDYALHLKGSSIYPEGERPDFDMFSPNHVEDAYELADLLYEKGFKQVGTVRAIHVQTMRVRTDFVWVADLSYMPSNIFDTIPTLTYKNLKIIHPDYQRAGLHLAFCFPFDNPPREDVFSRFKKDLQRYNLIEKYYPIPVVPVKSTYENKTFSIPFKRVAIHGFAAYALLYQTLNELRMTCKVPEWKTKFPQPSYSYHKNDKNITLTVDMPKAYPSLVLATYNPEEIIKEMGLHLTEICEPYMDYSPPIFKTKDIHFFSTMFKELAISIIQDNMIMVSPQYLLLYFLYGAFAIPTDKALFLFYYNATLWILEKADSLLNIIQKQTSPEEFMKFANTSPFVLTTRVLRCSQDRCTFSPAYRISLANDVQQSQLPLPKTHFLSNFLPDISTLPYNYYPGKGKDRPTNFSYEKNLLFNIGGKCTQLAM